MLLTMCYDRVPDIVSVSVADDAFDHVIWQCYPVLCLCTVVYPVLVHWMSVLCLCTVMTEYPILCLCTVMDHALSM